MWQAWPCGCQTLSQGLIQLSSLSLQNSGLGGLGHCEEGVGQAVVQACEFTAGLHGSRDVVLPLLLLQGQLGSQPGYLFLKFNRMNAKRETSLASSILLWEE